MRVTVDLILRGFKKNKPLSDIAQTAGVTVNAIKSYVKLGGRGSAIYKPLYDYYEAEIIPQKLDKFLNGNETKSIKKAMESADLTEDELDKYYELGKNGDERFEEFYKEFYDIKKGTYVYHRNKGKSHNIAMRESRLSDEEYDESKADIEKLLKMIKINIVLETVASDKTSNVAASKAGCTVDEIYEWYFKGRSGDEDYKEFYESFHKAYVRPSAVPLQEKLDNENAKLDTLIKSNKDKFTKKDVDIWLKHGIIHLGVIHLDEEKDDEDEDDEEEKVKKFNLDKRIGRVNPRSSLGGVQDNDDIEELKRQILKK